MDLAACRRLHRQNQLSCFQGSLFSYIFANKNFVTDLHADGGDLAEGFTVLTVIEEGSYEGAYTVLPAYGIAFDVREGDLLLLRSQVEPPWQLSQGRTPVQGGHLSLACTIEFEPPEIPASRRSPARDQLQAPPTL